MDNLFTNVSLKNCPISALKVRTVVNLLRGQSVSYALSALRYHSKRNISEYLSKLVKAGVASWKEKHEDGKVDLLQSLYISEIAVNQGSYIKRMRAASRGRVHKVNKPYSHILLTIKSKSDANKMDVIADSATSRNNKKEAK